MAITHWKYNEQGRMIESGYFGVDGKLKVDGMVFGVTHFWYDGQITEIRHFFPDGKPIAINSEVAMPNFSCTENSCTVNIR
jgi:hypothetical protein